ncbi:tumor necrosis factor receptor type 1-associated DEATH domain protein isoform X2 [Bombina bombina]|nr:tumor necrosis factor receptor type 1-associated DEATH domain protein isoform X2 [Bombina bombina]
MATTPNGWIGGAYLFVQSDQTSLPDQYNSNRLEVYRALRSALSESIEILKIHCSEPHLILNLKFCGKEPCQMFIQHYRAQRVHQNIQEDLQSCLSLDFVPICLELKVGDINLNSMLEEEDLCLEYINSGRPTYQKDDEFVELDELLKKMTLGSSGQSNSSTPSLNCFTSAPHSLRTNGNLQSEGSTFNFQGQEFDDRVLSFDHHNLFAKSVGKKWKQVGRTLSKTCTALHDPAIDNLGFEYEREGLYEQAYQLLRKFKDCEGRKATLQRLIKALEENGLNNIADDLLSLP